MRLLLDTHILWEVALKHAARPENVKFSGREFAEYCRQAGYIPLALGNEHVFAAELLRRKEGAAHHADPFDRILIAQAKTEGMKFLTHDKLLSGYDEDCIIIV